MTYPFVPTYRFDAQTAAAPAGIASSSPSGIPPSAAKTPTIAAMPVSVVSRPMNQLDIGGPYGAA